MDKYDLEKYKDDRLGIAEQLNGVDKKANEELAAMRKRLRQ